MRKIVGTLFAVWLCSLLSVIGAESYSLADGTTMSGDVVSFNDNGIIFKTGEDTYSERLPWLKFSQDGLKQLAQNPKIAPFVEPFIEPAATEHAKPEVKLNNVPRLAHPAGGSLFGALFTSSVGLVVMLLVYAANVFAGYEIAVFRARPIGLGIGLAAVLPIFGPIILLSMPSASQAEPVEEIVQTAPVEAEPHRFAVPGTETPASVPQEEIQIVASGFTGAPPPPEDNSQMEIFQRGQFMFNRRFFETKFADFFGIVRSEADKKKVLNVKIPAALLNVERISRISANEIHFEVIQDGQRQEIMVPFAEIQQIQLKLKS
jgi:hypothetical protein